MTSQTMTSNQPDRSKPRFRVQEAILILRQGKSHPHWREAAWHLIENAAKDTALLLEAQRDLLAALPEEPWWQKPWAKAMLGAGFLLVVGTAAWLIIAQIIEACTA